MAISATTIPAKTLNRQLFNRCAVIPPWTDVLWRIEHGVVRTNTWSEEGRCITLGYWGPRDVVGHRLSRINPYEIECVTSVEMSVLPSELWDTALDAILLHIQQVAELLKIVNQNLIPLRLWQFLLWLGHKFGRDVDQGRLIDVRVTHQELAEATNTTRVTVTRLIQQFESEGMLLRYQRQIVICA